MTSLSAEVRAPLDLAHPKEVPDVENAIVVTVKCSQEENTSRSSNQNNFKWFVLAFLTIQNSSASLLMRYSRSESGASWNPQTGVVAQEVIKALTCVVLLIKDGGLSSAFMDKTEALKTAIP